MPNKRKTENDDDAWVRASQVNEAMLGIQPYADDSMFFTIRYVDKAKVIEEIQSQSQRRKGPNLTST